MGEMGDCPIFEGIYDYCRSYTGGSIQVRGCPPIDPAGRTRAAECRRPSCSWMQGAVRLNSGMADTVINWAGGLHHAHKSQASGKSPAIRGWGPVFCRTT